MLDQMKLDPFMRMKKSMSLNLKIRASTTSYKRWGWFLGSDK